MLNTAWFEKLIVRTITILLMLIIAVATLSLIYLFATNAWSGLKEVNNVADLQDTVQHGIAGVFIVLLGLELLETIKTYVTHHRFRLEVVLVVGAIAVARHIVQLDFHHTDGAFLAGLGVLIASLILGYYFLQRIPESKGGNRAEDKAVEG